MKNMISFQEAFEKNISSIVLLIPIFFLCITASSIPKDFIISKTKFLAGFMGMILTILTGVIIVLILHDINYDFVFDDKETLWNKV